ncbi:PREDICTED: interferon-induced protein with tetratricopeptide repeats 1 [Elephantulus edwardii]|uniref:interferon-induced protein with tetratricopeptide repeats 1 n=1 Tax=Elephantulus edwardii TaxID=28737 RepID=UPI0003F0D863|nr:PREDICTED: interferon-induced protein with tetratricopeptide repeats 1 [Elephantulus edwardii]
MSEKAEEHRLEERLKQLRCHFTWSLPIMDIEIPDLESRILEEIEFLDTNYRAGIHNLMAYVKHLQGQNEDSLESLKRAEELTQQEHADQSDLRSLVTWGNYAWVYYHMGRMAESQAYLDKIANTCKKFVRAPCYRVECPEMDCEEGWALLKCGAQVTYERARICFEKALEVEPENPEFCIGYAITLFRLDSFASETRENDFSLPALRKAVRLNPEDVYIKVLLALKLQDVGQEAEGEQYIEEALRSKSSQTYVFRQASRFYRKKGFLEKAIQLLKMALQSAPTSAFLHHQIGLCYRAQVFDAKYGRTRWQDKETDKRIQLAISHFEYAVKQKPTFDIAYIHLATMYVAADQIHKAEETYQKVLSIKPLEDLKKQKVHFSYGRFQEFQKKSEIGAIAHYLEAAKVEKPSEVRDKSIQSLEKLAFRRFQRNALDKENLSLLGFICKLKGEMHKALEYYEEALKLDTDLEDSERPGL